MDFTTYELLGNIFHGADIYHRLCGQHVSEVRNISDAMQTATQHNVNCPKLNEERKGITSA